MPSQLVNAWAPDDPFVLDAMRSAEVERLRLIYDSSNYVYLATLRHPEHGEGLAIYKPVGGEQPLSDFPYGTLHRREVAAYEFARLLGWDIIPPTIEREGPQGTGSMQLFIEHDPACHYFALRREAVHREQFVRFAVFDLIANNADRKGGHLLLDAKGGLWGIDNGLCFHHVEKLRTVIWDFAGARLDKRGLADLERVHGLLASSDAAAEALRGCLKRSEVAALVQRCAAFLATPVLPQMYPWRCVPWPLI